MCVEISCFAGCDVIDFEINFIFGIKGFFYLTKNSKENFIDVEKE